MSDLSLILWLWSPVPPGSSSIFPMLPSKWLSTHLPCWASQEDEDVLPSGVARRHRTLEATNIAGSGNGTVRVTCSSQGKQAWSDLLLGQASAVGGSLQFAAVGLTDGSLVVRRHLRVPGT